MRKMLNLIISQIIKIKWKVPASEFYWLEECDGKIISATF